MSQLINSGIIYLEQFVDDTNLLPADLTRSLDYIRTLDERILGACMLGMRVHLLHGCTAVTTLCLLPLMMANSLCLGRGALRSAAHTCSDLLHTRIRCVQGSARLQG